jgi:hypothetical protein
VGVPLRALFARPTLAALAAEIDARRAADGTPDGDAAPALVPIARESRRARRAALADADGEKSAP